MFSRVLCLSMQKLRWRYRVHYRMRYSVLIALALILSACGLSSEPKVVSVLPTATAVPTSAVKDVGYPTTSPDLAKGAQIFAANCTKCHGPDGKGDGELVKAGSIPPPGDFTDPAKLGGQTPLDVFKTITNGRIEKLMPPWASGLSEADRWAVTMYSYTLSYKPDQIALGDKLATGDSLVSSGGINRLTNQFSQQQTMINLSDKVIETQISADSAVQSMTPEQRRALVIYLRRRSLAGSTGTQPVATEEATKSPSTPDTVTAGVINGQVSNGTAGGKVPPNQNLVLHVLDQDSKETAFNTTADVSGNFSFKDVLIRNDRMYVITTTYLNRIFGSDFVRGDPANKTMTLPVKIYELTSAPEVIKITGLTTQVNASSDGLQIAQIVRLRNQSDKLFTTDRKIGEDRYASVTLSLPKGAAIMGFANDEDRYSISPDGATITDTAPVVPGDEHVMHVIYTLPYREGTVIEQPINYTLDGTVQLFLQPETLSAISQQLSPLGVQNQRGTNVQTYGNALTLNAGSILSYELRGGAVAANSSAPTSMVSRELIVGILVGLGIGIVLVGIVFMVRDRMVNRSGSASAPRYDAETQQRIDHLVGQLAQLDDSYANGQLDQKSYEKRRQRLKIRLARLMGGTNQ